MSEQPKVSPAIALVRSAFADASSWNGVIEPSQQQGYTVGPANPLRGVAAASDVIGSMAQRAGADIVEVEGLHVIMVSQPQPQTVTGLILKAARAVVGSRR